ncbi:16S rRNA (guanine(527)-N(7))-methyltransferase RsmG [Sphingomonas sp. MMS24-J13]|uniref:16S rRNA (guanine(527)-N(7))-methyltransferase RsmG n=1 Tax=Sphingomonas sp. MMS24-J13 TaxID=3238686 RepID=UPI00384A53AF
MTEEEARAWLAARNVPRGTLDRLAQFADLVRREGANQNLISASTMDQMWARHIVDSAQLLDSAGEGDWLDLGSGAGFPGLVIALVGERPITLVESRAKRIAFLRQAVDVLGVANRVAVFGGRAEILPDRKYGVITARAFAPLPRLLAIAHRFSTPKTTWVLPKGRSAALELEEVAGSWQGSFGIVPSVTDSEAAIIVARDVRPGRS